MKSPTITRQRDSRTGRLTFRVSLEGTSRFLLFDETELSQLRKLIDRALEGNENDLRTTR